MADVRRVAEYIARRYERTFKVPLDEMKLHKLLYFVQRECFVLFNEPLFTDRFQAWKYGPVMVCLRSAQLSFPSDSEVDFPELERFGAAFDEVFRRYAHKNSWSLSSISHGETCWRKAKAKEQGGRPVEILTEDIREDAEIIKFRRLIFD